MQHHAFDLRPSSDTSVWVACLCAQWCGTCREYRTTFQQLQARFPALQFIWIDVEDDADLVDPVDVVDFPTLLIARGGDAMFFGPLLPQADTLARLLDAHLQPNANTASLGNQELNHLALRILERLPALGASR